MLSAGLKKPLRKSVCWVSFIIILVAKFAKKFFIYNLDFPGVLGGLAREKISHAEARSTQREKLYSQRRRVRKEVLSI